MLPKVTVGFLAHAALCLAFPSYLHRAVRLLIIHMLVIKRENSQSPTAVCPSPPASKGDGSCPPLTFITRDGSRLVLTPTPVSQASAGARRALQLMAPVSLLAPSSPSLSRPPGFEVPQAERTPPLPSTCIRTPSTNTSSSASSESPEALAPLFAPQPPSLLATPASPPPRRPTNRWKTLAGVSIACGGGYSIRKMSARLRARRRAAPIAKAAETMVCRNLGIIQNGEEVTELAMAEFARRFDGQVPEHVMATMRVLFKVNTPEEEELDLALLGLGGAAAQDQAVDNVEATLADV